MEVSFSIDLTGSTLAKQLIEKYCDTKDMQLKLLRTYNRILLIPQERRGVFHRRMSQRL